MTHLEREIQRAKFKAWNGYSAKRIHELHPHLEMIWCTAIKAAVAPGGNGELSPPTRKIADEIRRWRRQQGMAP